MQFAIAAPRSGFPQGSGIGQSAVLAGIAPKPDYRTYGHVEGAFCLRRQLLRSSQHTEQIRADTHWICGNPVQLAARLIVRKNLVEVPHAIECGPERRRSLLLAGSIELDAEERTHVRFDC